MTTTAADLRLLLRGSAIDANSPQIQADFVSTLPIDWPELEALLPDRGLPRGVVELSSPHALGGPTTVALSAIRAAQRREPRAWCAWLDPEATLYAPGLVAAGIALDRLLVVQPHRHELARVAVKLAASGAFDVIAIDVAAIPGSSARSPQKASSKSSRGRWPMEVLVRKLALLADEHGASILLLSDATAPRSLPWPVALRLELTRVSEHETTVRVGKDRRGRIGASRTIAHRLSDGDDVK